jgi:hypothetical protein
MCAMNRRTLMLASATLVAGAQHPTAAEYPQRPITIVVPYAAGGAGDTIIRLLANDGAPPRSAAGHRRTPRRGGTIGAQAVAKAVPDGYTLLLGATNNFVLNQFMFPKLHFDPFAAFTLITKVADIPSVLYTNPAVPAKTLGEFIAYAKANPGKLSYASPSVGTTPHLAVERLKQLTGIELIHVPIAARRFYAGGARGRCNSILPAGASAEATSRLTCPRWRSPARSAWQTCRFRRRARRRARLSGVNWWGLAAPHAATALDKIYRAVSVALAEKEIQRGWRNGFTASGEPPELISGDES